MIAPGSWPEAKALGLSPSDWQEVSDFRRFLQLVGPAQRGCMSALKRQTTRWYAWVWYMEGKCGAPPLMWEGDDN